MNMITILFLAILTSINCFGGDITSSQQTFDPATARIFRVFQNQDTGMITIRNCQLNNLNICRPAPVGGREFTEAEINRAGTILEKEIPSLEWAAGATVGGCVVGGAVGSEVGFAVGYIPGAGMGMIIGCLVGGAASGNGTAKYLRNKDQKSSEIFNGIKTSGLVIYSGSAEELESRINAVLSKIGPEADRVINKSNGVR